MIANARRAAERDEAWQRPADPSRSSLGNETLTRVYVWDGVVRLTHWLVALAILVLAVSGYYIGNPPIIDSGVYEPAPVMTVAKTIHSLAGLVFTISVLSRVLWGFVGTPPARWPSFLPFNRTRSREATQTLKFYLLLRRSFPPVLGHNPLAGATYFALYILFMVMVTTGLGLYGASTHISSPLYRFEWLSSLYGGLQSTRWIHHVGMWLVLGFFVHHLYSAVLAASVEKNGILESIFTGYKWVPTGHLSRRTSARARADNAWATVAYAGDEQMATISDISAQGARLAFLKPRIDPTLVPSVQVCLSVGVLGCRFQCRALVVWCRYSEPSEIGVQFVDVDPKIQSRLNCLVQQHVG